MTNSTPPCLEPAFPGQYDHGNGQIESWVGMSLRDYFAVRAMQAEYHLLERRDQFKMCAEGAYAMADAMLEARK